MSEELAPELLWDGARFVRGRALVVDDAGRIASVGAPGPRARALPRRALLPGFVSAHSHAFQRGLRGRGERFPRGAGSFWSWREAMYALVAELDEDALYALSRRAFEEMLAAGITSVGEFHYLHHARADERDWSLDAAVVRAARDAGIRLRLLQVYYRSGGFGRPLEGAQRRFDGGSPDEYWRRFDALQATLDPRLQSAGCVVHSVRAAPLDELRALHAEARRRGLCFHMHLEEQRREVEECRAVHGRAPLRLVLDELEPDRRFTCVHGTHAGERELSELRAAGGTLCVCPLTEANLGDGICALEPLREPGAEEPLALGTDSNARLSMLEEMRWLEYAQRLRREERGVLCDSEGRVAERLLRAATAGGARALDLEAGALRPGAWADLVLVDLDAPALAGCDDEALAAALVLGAGEEALAGVAVGGRWRAEAPR